MFLFIMIMAFCANSLALDAGVAESKSDIKTDLVAPLPSSISQYYQPPALINLQLLRQQQELLQNPQTLAQLLGIQSQQYHNQPIQHHQQQPIVQPIHQTQINPFLYLGQLTLSDTGEHKTINSNNNQQLTKAPQNPLPKKRSDERSLQNQERSSYDLYRPSSEENHEFVDLSPPSASQEEPNYYVMMVKPRKFKKFVEQDTTEKKLKARKDTGKLKHQIKRSEQEKPKSNNESDLLTDSSDYVEQSEPTSRLDFQMHGHKGPKSYKFGFDYGSNAGLSRQFRVEERDSNGDVHGKYGYFDRKGKFHEVKYSSTAKDGFRVHT